MGNYLFSYGAIEKFYTLEDYELEVASNCKNLFFYNINELQDKSWTTVASDQIEGIHQTFECEE